MFFVKKQSWWNVLANGTTAHDKIMAKCQPLGGIHVTVDKILNPSAKTQAAYRGTTFIDRRFIYEILVQITIMRFLFMVQRTVWFENAARFASLKESSNSVICTISWRETTAFEGSSLCPHDETSIKYIATNAYKNVSQQLWLTILIKKIQTITHNEFKIIMW